MKCPKCGYLGFGQTERCRNCGYDFLLAQAVRAPDLALRKEQDSLRPLEDLALVEARPAERNAAPQKRIKAELPLFGQAPADDRPLITRASPPRPPLAVRRSTPEVPRLRSNQPRPPMLDLMPFEPDAPVSAIEPSHSNPDVGRPMADAIDARPAGLFARLAAVAIDLMILAAIDIAVVYFTAQICGLGLRNLRMLPKIPLIAFLLVQNGGYLIAFTAGGQTLGKMAAGIRVVTMHPDATLDLGRSLLRTLVWAALAVPAGLGFLTAPFSPDHRGLHDHCAGTKVVRV